MSSSKPQPSSQPPPQSLLNIDLHDPSLYADLENKPEFKLPSYEVNLDNVIVVDNVPQVSAEKEDKLKNVLRKTFKSFSNVKDDGVHLLPIPDPANPGATLTQSFAFVEFETAKDAQIAVAKADGHRLDKNHVFACNLFTDIEKYANHPGELKLPEPEPFQEQDHIKGWLVDPLAREQFITRQADDTSVYYSSRTGEPEKVYSRPAWTENYVNWSPKGSYLTTFHKQGNAIWGGKTWKRLKRFSHERVKMILWSPEENYLITVAHEGTKTDDGEVHNIFFWDFKSGKVLKTFGAGKPFKFSHDDKFVARLGPGCINVYELPSLKLVDQKPFVTDDIKDFEWSPVENSIVYWTPEVGNNPARVAIVDVPSKVTKKTKNLFNVQDCKLQWHPNGDFLAAKVDRTTKTKKSSYVSFEIFRIREKDIPVEILDLKDPLVAFAWEPHGDKIAIIHGEGNTHNVSFYTLDSAKKGSPIHLLKTLERKSVNRLYWSPKGQFIVLAGFKNFNGVLEFWNVNDLEQMEASEHYQCTDLEWDPTGRFVATWASAWIHNMENGYHIYDFKGKQLFGVQLDKFYTFLWRPHPTTLLSKDQMREIRKNLKDYSSEFSRQDDLKDNKMSALILERRRQLMEDWLAYRRTKAAEYAAQKPLRTTIRGFDSDDEDGDTEVVEELVEEVVEEKKVFLE